ncbi:hypothetical protein AMATHDRAFT_59842 [Amanita thiersii Skay4041]|uniref:Major facilitator superfamily (MFS) profile domain-containing protein n=1 Tax=Amanita thiersii Skay4041 TaxID=703135 RepID=A0A2A9NTT1_9AGAR|nr:hypothetical protein AMATHDRAFT_59842 [Amanita thiersii Skay4041]
MVDQSNEETPLLGSQQTKNVSTPLPWSQIVLLLFLQLAGPMTSNVIYPFAPELIRDIGITNGNEMKVGYYVGIMQSIYAIMQAITTLHWGQMSDSVGRKPVLLVGLFGLSVSMFCFGLWRTFWGLVMSRSLSGALNGNVGVGNSMMVELTDSTNIAKGYALMPIAWSTGGTLGPIIGGLFSRPAERFPKLFGNNAFLKTYPYFLSCAIPATYSAMAFIVAYIFLRETVKRPVPIFQFLRLRKAKNDAQSQVDQQEQVEGDNSRQAVSDEERPLPLRSLLIPRVLLAMGNCALLTLVDISFRAIQPVFFATPIEYGGLGLSPAHIGNILSAFAILNGVFQVCCFAAIHDKLGSKKTFVIGITSALPMFASFPVISFIVQTRGYGAAVWITVALQVLASVLISLSYGAIFIFVAGSSPNRASLGATNGLSQLTFSTMRAIGPAAANSLYSLSLDKGYFGGNLVYYVLIGVVIVSLYIASLLPRNAWK